MDYERQFLYGIRVGEFIKIGISKNPMTRLQAVNTCSPYEAKLEFYAQHHEEESHHIESKMHKILTSLGRHQRLEWFYYKGDEVNILLDNAVANKSKLEVQHTNGASYEQQVAEALSLVARDFSTVGYNHKHTCN